ncbi:MAG: FxsA family protein [Nitrospinota bacterium]
MLIRLFLLFIIIPLIEIAILMKLGTIFGVLHTIGLVIITGIIGAFLARAQGLKVIRELQVSLSKGDVPTDPIIEGILLLISAALLVTPGVLTDIVGFILVIPYTRKIIRDVLKEYFKGKIAQGIYSGMKSDGSWFYYGSSGSQTGHGKRLNKKDDDDVIDI